MEMYDSLTLNHDHLRRALWSILSPRRAVHTLGVEDCAATLAMRWGVCADKARLAALLHDLTKENHKQPQNQLKLLEEYDILLCEWEPCVPEAYHALTGAALAARLGASPEVCAAIRAHTTGRAGMSDLAIILYLADWIEPSRADTEGLAQLRRLCFTDLHRALALGLTLSLRHVQSRGRAVDPRSGEALAWVTERLYDHEGKKTG
jgi:nicotinate-nucleotide adenylyltransferase